MNSVNLGELIAFILYFLIVLGMGVYFFIRGRKDTGEKSYFLGGRKMGGVVAALSAGASDMSAWVLMGLPGSIYLAGVGQIWISVGLLIGTILAWILVAPKLRRYSMLADDSITIPQYLTRRFKSSSSVLQVVCAMHGALHHFEVVHLADMRLNRCLEDEHRCRSAVNRSNLCAVLADRLRSVGYRRSHLTEELHQAAYAHVANT